MSWVLAVWDELQFCTWEMWVRIPLVAPFWGELQQCQFCGGGFGVVDGGEF